MCTGCSVQFACNTWNYGSLQTVFETSDDVGTPRVVPGKAADIIDDLLFHEALIQFFGGLTFLGTVSLVIASALQWILKPIHVFSTESAELMGRLFEDLECARAPAIYIPNYV